MSGPKRGSPWSQGKGGFLPGPGGSGPRGVLPGPGGLVQGEGVPAWSRGVPAWSRGGRLVPGQVPLPCEQNDTHM